MDARAVPLDPANPTADPANPTADAVFCDPARRHTDGTGRRVFDPASYSPPWDFVTGLASRVPLTVLKLAPGIDHALVPAGAEAEWVSVDGDLVEATIWPAPLATAPRRATLLRNGGSGGTGAGAAGMRPPAEYTLTGSGVARAPVGPVRRYLYSPDPAVIRAHLVAEFASTVGGTLADPDIAYVYADSPVDTPFARRLEVVETLPFSVKRLRAALRARGVGRVTLLKRGSAVDVERLRRQLRLAGQTDATVVLTRVAGAPTAVLCAQCQRSTDV
jgi:hypothetical protein